MLCTGCVVQVPRMSLESVGAEVEQLMSLSRDGRFSKFVIYITKFATIHAKVKNFQRVMQHFALWIRRKTTEIFACF